MVPGLKKVFKLILCNKSINKLIKKCPEKVRIAGLLELKKSEAVETMGLKVDSKMSKHSQNSNKSQ